MGVPPRIDFLHDPRNKPLTGFAILHDPENKGDNLQDLDGKGFSWCRTVRFSKIHLEGHAICSATSEGHSYQYSWLVETQRRILPFGFRQIDNFS